MRGFDVVIVGGGIIGGSIAFELAQEKLRVLVLDRQAPGQEASWAAAGMLSPSPENPDSIPLVPLARASLELYPEFVATVEEASGRAVGYRSKGTLEVLLAGEAGRELSTLIALHQDRKSTRLNSSHRCISYAVFCLKKKKEHEHVDKGRARG